MAKLKKGIMGPLSGKIGPVVGASWKGVDYLRAAPETKGTGFAQSERQIAHQQKFKFITNFLDPFLPYVNIGFFKPNVQKTEYNMAFSYNFQEAVVGSHPDLLVDYNKFSISRGSQAGLSNLQFEWVSLSEVRFTWLNESGYHARYDDQVMVVLYSPELQDTNGAIGAAYRRDGHVDFKLKEKFVGKALEVYVAVSTINRKKTSNSQYLGRKEFL